MSTLDRMIKERNRLLAEAAKIDDAIKLINSFKDGDSSSSQKIKKVKGTRSTNMGLYAAVKECAKEAILKHGRPVTKEEILELLPNYGFSLNQVNMDHFPQMLYPKFCGQGAGVRNATIWYKGKPRPEAEERKKELQKVI